jgi:hypothetical protein
MENANSNPFIIAVFFVLRCLVPLFIMLGISYLLKRFGFIAPPVKPPPDKDNGNNNDDHHPNHNNNEGGMAHV